MSGSFTPLMWAQMNKYVRTVKVKNIYFLQKKKKNYGATLLGFNFSMKKT